MLKDKPSPIEFGISLPENEWRVCGAGKTKAPHLVEMNGIVVTVLLGLGFPLLSDVLRILSIFSEY